ncbi:MAG: HAMP domain-containing protein [Proteobacteria bacterium]|nr:HAMP domain-containing protein [Pseudomonadota bacterium]
MKNLKFFRFKTLQGRLILLLLVPVFLTFFAGSIVSFIYTRNIMITQWNESSVLKLQRAAHYLEMQVLKPIELLNTLYMIPYFQDMAKSKNELMKNLAALEGIVRVGITYSQDNEINELRPHHSMHMGDQGQMQIHRSQILTITEPEYDTDAAQETVTLVLSLLDSSDQIAGNLEIVMSFKYLLKDIFKLGWWQSDMACIVDQNGKYLVHTNMLMKGRQFLGGTDNLIENAVLKEMGEKPSGTIQSGGHPPDMVAGFQKLEHLPWTIILFAKGEKIFKPIIDYRNAFGLGGIFLIIIILVLIRLQVGNIVEKIKTLSEKAKKVAKGDYGDPLKIETQDEIGQLVQSYNSMTKGLKERDFIRDSFGRYVDPEFAKFLLQHPDAGKLGGERREVAILMSDIRGFTALSETLSPEVIINVLNQYFSHMIAIIQRYNGIIVDFFGDAILVFFEPFSSSMEDTAQHCIQCATDMQNEMNRFNRKMKNKNLPELNMGIGINTGQVIVGNIGSESRAKYGIVGSAVNITSRIQAKAEEKEIIVSDAVYNYLKNEPRIKKSFSTTMKGIDHPMTLHVIEPKSE